MKVVIPMSGMSSRFAAAGYDIPKYLIEVDGKKVIEHIVNLYPEDSDFVFIINMFLDWCIPCNEKRIHFNGDDCFIYIDIFYMWLFFIQIVSSTGW